MNLVRIDGGKIGLLVQLRTGPHVVDIVKSLGVFAARDPVSGSLMNGVLRTKGEMRLGRSGQQLGLFADAAQAIGAHCAHQR